MDIPLLSIRQLTDIWATRNLLCCEHSCVSFHVDKVFIFLGWIPRMGLLGYYGRTVFQSSCVLFFHVFIDHLYILFGGMSIQIPLLIGLSFVDWYLNTELTLLFWDKLYLIKMYYPSYVLLDYICVSEDFCFCAWRILWGCSCFCCLFFVCVCVWCPCLDIVLVLLLSSNPGLIKWGGMCSLL